jgi:hypothetical protein
MLVPNSKAKELELRGWLAIAEFLGMPQSTVHRWAREGMPVRRAGRSVIANPEELNQWLRRTTGEAVGVHVATPGSDLLKDLRASIAAQNGVGNSPAKRLNERMRHPSVKTRKTRASRKT